jgi:hypothetical protein
VSEQNPPAGSTSLPTSKSTEPTPAVITEADMADPAIAGKPAHVKVGGDAPQADSQEIVFVQQPLPPVRKGNRIVGAALSLLAAVVYGAIFAGVMAIVSANVRGGIRLNFLQAPTFYIPIVLFLVGMILLVLVVNRAGWWTHIIGSLLVALFVYFGTVGMLLLLDGVVAKTPSVAAIDFQHGLQNPLVIAAALIARELAIWFGALISWRGKRVKARNVVTREEFDREQAELAAT